MPSGTDASTTTSPAVDPGSRHRQVSVAFIDLVGSTNLIEALGPDDYADQLRGFHTLCTEVVRHHGGTVAQYLGDGMMCFFGYPTATEGDARKAVLAGLDVLALVRARNPGLAAPIEARLGIASGAALVAMGTDHFGSRAVGACLNLAARLQGIAEPGTVVVCDDTAGLVGQAFRTRSLGHHDIKGFAGTRELHRVVGLPHGVVSRFGAHWTREDHPLVGRRAELGSLMAAYRDARGGRGGSILVEGEAGLGKSRLVHGLLEAGELAGAPSFVLQCAPEFAMVSLHPVREYLDWISGVGRHDTDDTRRTRLARLFSSVWQAGPAEVEDLLDLLAPVATPGPPRGEETAVAKRRRGFAVLAARLFGAAGRDSAVVVSFEDVHWIDPTTLEFLGFLLGEAARHRVLLLATTRPGGIAPPSGTGFGRHVRLEPLDPGEASELAAGVATRHGLSDATIDEIVVMAEGVPLFLEEYAKLAAREGRRDGAGAGAGDREGHRTGRRNGRSGGIPLGLAAIVQGQLDRLGPMATAFANAASVLGRRFQAEVVGTIADIDPASLGDVLEELVSARVIDPVGDEDHLFSHALIRDGVHGTLQGGLRRRLHRRAAEALEGAHGRTAPHVVIAKHHAQADQREPAALKFLDAAREALGVGTVDEAMAHLLDALEQVDALPAGVERDRLELSVRALQGPTWMVLRGPGSPDFGATQERARELLERLDLASTGGPVIFHTALHAWARGDFATALERVERLDEMAADATRDVGLDLARRAMRGLVAWHAGDNATALEELHGMLNRYDPAAHAPLYATWLMEFGVFGRFYLALSETVTGNTERGAALAREAAEMAMRGSFPHAKGFSQLAAFLCAMLRDDVRTCDEHSRRALAFSGAQGFPEFVAAATFAQGWVRCRRGHPVEGTHLMTQGLTRWDATGFATWQPLFRALLAIELVAMDRLDAARDHLDVADADIRRTRECQAEPLLLLSRARLERSRGRTAAGADLATNALRVARAQGAMLWVDRVARAFPESGAR